jgi:hypothetical protein
MFPHLGPEYAGSTRYNAGNPGGHSNLSTWFRLQRGHFPGLMDDNCQQEMPAAGGKKQHDHCGFGAGLYRDEFGKFNGKTRAIPTTGSGPDAPYDTPFDVELKFTRQKNSYTVDVLQNGERRRMTNSLFGLALSMKKVSMIGITYTNHRNYDTVTLANFRVEGADVPLPSP